MGKKAAGGAAECFGLVAEGGEVRTGVGGGGLKRRIRNPSYGAKGYFAGRG